MTWRSIKAGVLGALRPGQQEHARKLLTRLVTVKGTRARRDEATLLAGDAITTARAGDTAVKIAST